jgi:hypothetical protein
MASIFRVMGLLAGHAMKNQAVNMAVSTTSRMFYREMRLTDIRLKLGLLKRKRGPHIKLLGRTVYLLATRECPTYDTESTRTLTRVLLDIDGEISFARMELERRKAEEDTKRGKP